MVTEIHVARLKRQDGIYVSGLDYNADNGTFYKLVVTPIDGVIEFMKERRGFRVRGEGHVASGNSEAAVNRRVSEYMEKLSVETEELPLKECERVIHRRLLPREFKKE